MQKFFKLLFILILLNSCEIYAQEFAYILNDKCINELYELAEEYFTGFSIVPIRDARGLILRIDSKDLNNDAIINLRKIEYFLAKIENPAIIEVHMGKTSQYVARDLKKWEISTIIANRIESIITKPQGLIESTRINSVGYGEFLPAKNTPNNGGKYLNRVDIIILCNISGE